jgi:uncharacterized membrane protein
VLLPRDWALVVVVAVGMYMGASTLVQHLWYRHAQSPYDVYAVYQPYGDAIASGRVPYRDFEVEYPPGALVAFAAPELSVRRGDTGAYLRVFQRWMIGVGAVAIVLAAVALAALGATLTQATASLSLLALSPLLVGPFLFQKFDLLPAALTVGGLAALLAKRDRAGAVLLGAAAATKLYPAALIPLGIAWVWRRHGWRKATEWTAIAVGACAVLFLPFFVLSAHGVIHSLNLQLARPLQLESLGAQVLIAAHHMGGLAVTSVSGPMSQDLAASSASAVSDLTTLLQFAGLATVWVAFALGPPSPERLVTAFAASAAVLVAFGKVLSPQYLIWLLPLVLLVRSRAVTALFIAALLLTQLEFPTRYEGVSALRAADTWLVFSRDLVLVLLACVLLRRLLALEKIGAREATAFLGAVSSSRRF